LDEVIIFQQLTKHDLSQIADIMLAQLCDRTNEQNFTLNVTPRAKDLLIDEGFDPIYGARPLRRAIMKLLEDKLANTVLSENIDPGSLVLVDVNDQKELSILVDRSTVDMDIEETKEKDVVLA
jgi:ATP-dependent Clp protease ATP-binding subunit ClpC